MGSPSGVEHQQNPVWLWHCTGRKWPSEWHCGTKMVAAGLTWPPLFWASRAWLCASWHLDRPGSKTERHVCSVSVRSTGGGASSSSSSGGVDGRRYVPEQRARGASRSCVLMHCALWKAHSDLYSLPLLPHTALWRPLWQSRTQPRGHMFSAIKKGCKTNMFRKNFV